VALAAALEAGSCELVKDPGALHTADPRLVPEARPIREASHRFVTELALAGARVIHHVAATRAERDGVPLRFTSLQVDGEPATAVEQAGEYLPAHAVVLGFGHRGIAAAAGDAPDVATVSMVTVAEDAVAHRAAAGTAAARVGATVLRTEFRPHVVSFLVPAGEGDALLRALHATIAVPPRTGGPARRTYAGHR
jgi:aspartokinase